MWSIVKGVNFAFMSPNPGCIKTLYSSLDECVIACVCVSYRVSTAWPGHSSPSSPSSRFMRRTVSVYFVIIIITYLYTYFYCLFIFILLRVFEGMSLYLTCKTPRPQPHNILVSWEFCCCFSLINLINCCKNPTVMSTLSPFLHGLILR